MSQLICQPLSAYFLVKFKLSIYVPVIVICWGITLACMAAARTFSGLLISRIVVSPTAHYTDRSIMTSISIIARYIWDVCPRSLYFDSSNMVSTARAEYSDNQWVVYYSWNHIQLTCPIQYGIPILVSPTFLELFSCMELDISIQPRYIPIKLFPFYSVRWPSLWAFSRQWIASSLT